MATLPPISINGASYSWGHINLAMVTALGTPYESRGYTDLSWGESLDVEKGGVMGTNRAPVKRSLGEYTADDATISGYQADIEALLMFLASQSGGSYGDPEFTTTAVFANPLELVHTVTLHRCRVIGVSAAYSAGNALLKQDLTLSVMSVSRGGNHLHSTF